MGPPKERPELEGLASPTSPESFEFVHQNGIVPKEFLHSSGIVLATSELIEHEKPSVRSVVGSPVRPEIG
jgi:hypothetical protein